MSKGRARRPCRANIVFFMWLTGDGSPCRMLLSSAVAAFPPPEPSEQRWMERWSLVDWNLTQFLASGLGRPAASVHGVWDHLVRCRPRKPRDHGLTRWISSLPPACFCLVLRHAERRPTFAPRGQAGRCNRARVRSPCIVAILQSGLLL